MTFRRWYVTISECKWTETIAFDNGDISSQKRHGFIVLLFVLECFCYQQIRLFLGIRNRFKKTKGGGRGRKPFSSSLPTRAPKRSFPALSAYKCLMLRLSQKELWDREGNTQSSPWDAWISPKLFIPITIVNAWNQSELVSGEVHKLLFSIIKRDHRTLCSLVVSLSQYSAMFALKQSLVYLLTYQTID